ncbi:MAG: DUF554 domain-containing protein [Verrucomicrobia bacterium]|nr:DUF554 domain-containing protein [Verrucomicrobiota bacterium]
MIGTAINAAAILAGGTVGLASKSQLSIRRQQNLRIILGVFAVYFGLRAFWIGIGIPGGQRLRNFLVVLIALMLGKLTGNLIGIQRRLNVLGKHAKQQYELAEQSRQRRFSDGFVAGAILYCMAPLATLGAIQDGLLADFRILVVKAVMDGMAMITFARSFGWSILVSALPVAAYQGTITLLARLLAPELEARFLLGSVYAATGFMVFAVALAILKLRKTEVSDYFPALFFAPFLSWLVG